MIEVYTLMMEGGKEVLSVTESLADMAQAITETEQEYIKYNLDEQWFGGMAELQAALDTLEQETASIAEHMTRNIKATRYHYGNLVAGLDFYAGKYVVQAFTLYNSRPDHK